jgi:hypothetical protein
MLGFVSCRKGNAKNCILQQRTFKLFLNRAKVTLFSARPFIVCLLKKSIGEMGPFPSKILNFAG